MSRTITLGFRAIPSTSIVIADDADVDDIVRAVVTLPEVDRALRDAVTDAVEPLFSRDGDLDQSTLNAAAAAFLQSGADGLRDWALTVVDAGQHNDRISQRIEENATYENIGNVLARAVEAATGTDADGEDLLRDRQGELIDEVLGSTDTSTPADLIGPHDHVLVTYVPGYQSGFEDDAILGDHKSLRPNDVELVRTSEGPRLPEGYLAYLRMVNADPVALQAELAECGLAPVGPEAEASGHAEAWRAAQWGYDPSRPSLHDAHIVRTVLENTSDCALATLTMRVPLRTLIAHDFTKPALVTPTARGRACAGFVNFVHGAGHEEPVRQPIELPPGRETWHSAETKYFSYDAVFGIVPSAYAVTLGVAVAQAEAA